YTITATAADGSVDTAVITLEVAAPGPPIMSDQTAPDAIHTVAYAYTIVNSGEDVVSCDDTDTLPAGLSVVVNTSATPDSCQITGTPSAVTASTAYTITATASDGSTDTAEIT